ncbi:MAG: hypothetical protein HY340_02500 [Candidatus Kerfeldbacteria bacterium]|nr:hypothetical protein [Candidatus Kerfeldbacteria bacterium]
MDERRSSRQVNAFASLKALAADLGPPCLTPALETKVNLRVDEIKPLYFFFNKVFEQFVARLHFDSLRRCGTGVVRSRLMSPPLDRG